MLNSPATLTDVARVQWKLGNYLERNKITAYQLGKELGGQTKMPNLYRITNTKDGPTRVDLNLLGDIITALEKLTGQAVGLDDLLEVNRD